MKVQAKQAADIGDIQGFIIDMQHRTLALQSALEAMATSDYNNVEPDALLGLGKFTEQVHQDLLRLERACLDADGGGR